MIILFKRFVAVVFLFVLFGIFHAEGAEIWVSPKGNNANSGTKQKPLADIVLALRKARDFRRL